MNEYRNNNQFRVHDTVLDLSNKQVHYPEYVHVCLFWFGSHCFTQDSARLASSPVPQKRAWYTLTAHAPDFPDFLGNRIPSVHVRTTYDVVFNTAHCQ